MTSFCPALDFRYRSSIIFWNMCLVVAFRAMRLFWIRAFHTGFCHKSITSIVFIYSISILKKKIFILFAEYFCQRVYRNKCRRMDYFVREGSHSFMENNKRLKIGQCYGILNICRGKNLQKQPIAGLGKAALNMLPMLFSITMVK